MIRPNKSSLTAAAVVLVALASCKVGDEPKQQSATTPSDNQSASPLSNPKPGTPGTAPSSRSPQAPSAAAPPAKNP